MRLQKQHRQSLLSELTKAKEDLSIQQRCLNQKKNENINDMFEISIFLAQKRI